MTFSYSFQTFEFCPYTGSQRRSTMARQEKLPGQEKSRRHRLPGSLGSQKHFYKWGIGTADEMLDLILASRALGEAEARSMLGHAWPRL